MTTSKNKTNAGRRAFLSNAASVAAVTVAASIIRPAAAAVALSPDPIFAAIEAHKAACVTTRKALDLHSALDQELPVEKCLSSVTAFGETIVATDDPRWIECERAMTRCHDDETDAACTLVSIVPTTMAGVVALLQYANAADTDGLAWPPELESDDGSKSRSWHYFLIDTVSAVLADLVSA
jgi:hypothetical protein